MTETTSRFARAVFDVKTRVAQRDIRAVDASLSVSERWSSDRLEEHQLDRAMELARHAFGTTQFYRDAYTAAGIELGDLDDPETFRHLPIVEKQDIRAHGAEMASRTRRLRDVLVSRTGGSTGEPLEVLHDKRAPVAAMWWRPYRWWGVSPADNSAHIYRQSRSARQELLHRLEWWPTRSLLLNARGMTTKSMREFARSWQRVRPRLLNGYVDAVHEFAQFVESEQVSVTLPHAIAVTSSMIQPSQRHFIERVLGAPVYDCYRSAEVPWLAAQCEVREGLHVMADLRLLELVDEQGGRVPSGSAGEVVVTDLCNRVFPLIRYRLGDRSCLPGHSCTCGRTLPLMEPVHGRLVDVLRSPRGHRITGGLGALFARWPTAVQKFQIHQRADYSVVVRCVPGESAALAQLAAETVVNDVSAMLGGSAAVRFDMVSSIPHEGGKIRLVVSDVRDPA